MTDDEAIAICEGWFAYIQRQKDRARKMAELATMARNGQQEEAQRQMRQMDRKPSVYDGARLEPAVRHLVKRLRVGNSQEPTKDTPSWAYQDWSYEASEAENQIPVPEVEHVCTPDIYNDATESFLCGTCGKRA